MPVEQQMQRACLSLEGLSIGDAFGQQFFLPHVAAGPSRQPTHSTWNYTDDTEMTLALVETLHHHHAIHQDDFALKLASRYESQPIVAMEPAHEGCYRRFLLVVTGGA